MDKQERILFEIDEKQKKLIKDLNSKNSIPNQAKFLLDRVFKLKYDRSFENFYYLQDISKGSGLLKIKDNVHIISNNSIVIVNPYQNHLIKFNQPEKADTNTIGLTLEDINEFITVLKNYDNKLLDNKNQTDNSDYEFKKNFYSNNKELSNKVKKAIYGEPGNIANEFAREIFKQELLYYVINQDIKQNIKNYELTHKIKDEIKSRLALVLEYLHDNYNKKIRIDSITMLTGLSKSRFMQLFKEYIGYSPYQYVTKIRIDKAIELLYNTNLSITEISFQIGYPAISSFTRVFKNQTGRLPSDYRLNKK